MCYETHCVIPFIFVSKALCEYVCGLAIGFGDLDRKGTFCITFVQKREINAVSALNVSHRWVLACLNHPRCGFVVFAEHEGRTRG